MEMYAWAVQFIGASGFLHFSLRNIRILLLQYCIQIFQEYHRIKMWFLCISDMGNLLFSEEEKWEFNFFWIFGTGAYMFVWPCVLFLWFFFLSHFTHTILTSVLVLQAEKASWNSIGIFKVSNITGKRRELVPSKPAADNSDMESEGSDSDEDSEEEELQGSGTPILQAMSCFFWHFVNFMTDFYLCCLFFT